MLPFPKRKTHDDIVELEDEDLVEIEPPPSIPVIFAEEERASRPSRPKFSRRVTSPDLEQDVVGECLASISASTTRGRMLTPLTLPSPPASRRSIPPPSSSSMVASRLPAVAPPPFVRTAPRSEPSIFTRTSTPAPPPSSSFPAVPSVPSIAPSTSSIRPEPTVILVRERPRAGWMVGAAVVGAACAIIATRVITAPDPAPAPQVVAAPAPPPPPPTQVVVPAAPVVTATASTPAAALTVKFTDDDAVAIPPPSAAPASPKPAPVASAAPAKPKPKPKAAVGPMLPDGTLTLTPAASGQAAPAAPPAPPPGPLAPVRKFTPEQELAAAQLKAASK